MKKKPILIIILSVIVTGMVGWTIYDFVMPINGDSSEETEETEETEQSGEVGLEVGQIAPDFELETMEGESVKLSDYKGEKVIVNFWATWCPPCREEIPDFKKLYDNRDVEILAIDLIETENNMEDVEKFVYDEFEMPFPVLLDENSDVSTTYNVMAYPTFYMVDSEGRIQFIALGAMNYGQMEERLNQMD